MASINTANMLRLVALAAIWGGSFLFMRIAAPVLGPALLIEARLALAAVFLALVGALLARRGDGAPLRVRRHWQHYLVLGVFNSALPFLLIAFAARTLSASVLAVLNATAPLWGALVGAVWARQPVSARSALGLLLGAGGVTLLVGFDHVIERPGAALAVCATLGAAFSYSVASQYAKSAAARKGDVAPFANAHGSMWAAAIVTLPLVPFMPAPGAPTPGVMGAVLALGVLCSGVAYILYFKLIEEIGPTSALTVTFLSPVFGILWGALFLHEAIGWHTIAGSAIVLIGTALVTGFRPRLTRSPRAVGK